MRRMFEVLAAAALLVGTQTGCERVVGLKVTDGPTLLVVEARLEVRRAEERPAGVTPSPQRIRLTTTAPYFTNEPAPPARAAVVQVVDDAGRSVALSEVVGSPGTYAAPDLPIELGRGYTLRIQWEGDQYESSEVVQPAVPIDSLYFVAHPNHAAATDGLRATIDARDPPVVANYYLWDQWVDGARQVSPDTATRVRALADDAILNGRVVRRFQPYPDVAVRSGQVVQVRQFGISSAAYAYYLAFNGEIGGDGSPFSLPSASLRGNVRNVTNPRKRALGYYIASEYSERTLTVP
jgi:Domain of unknown function (DUF4249)